MLGTIASTAVVTLAALTAGSPDPEGTALRAAVDKARNWLADHQDADGRWDADGFEEHDPQDAPSGGRGKAEEDVGVTGLALLAFLGDGQTHLVGPNHEQVARGLQWLVAQQDPASGLIGGKTGHSYTYRHAIATLALCEAHLLGGDERWKAPAQKAVGFALRARNPYGVWRYDCPPVGDNDSSVTGWMVAALRSAKDGGLEVDGRAFADALAWYDQVTDPETGRVGYDSRGSRSARVPGVNDRFPTDRTEAMTAIGLTSRFLLGQEPDRAPVMKQHADLLLKALPDWSPSGDTNDVYYWYHGTFAMYQMGGTHWESWRQALKHVFLAKQIDEGSARGSWDPDGPWGQIGGRVFSTAMGVIALEAWSRYERLYGTR